MTPSKTNLDTVKFSVNPNISRSNGHHSVWEFGSGEQDALSLRGRGLRIYRVDT